MPGIHQLGWSGLLDRGLQISSQSRSVNVARQIASGPTGGGGQLPALTPAMYGSSGPTLNVAVWCMVGISLGFILLRVYCKIFKHKGLWWDDYVLIASWLMFLVNAITATVDVSMGLGRHIDVLIVEGKDLSSILQMLSISSFMGILGAAWSKTSFGITLLRLTDGWTKMLVWFIIISMNLVMTADALLDFLACEPVEKTWHPEIPGTCWNPVAFAIFAGCYSGVMDIVLALLPWKIMWHLNMKKKEKIGVAFAMSMGVFAGATAFAKSAKIPTIADEDPTYAIPELIIWGAAEIAMTIVATCIPVLRVLLRDVGGSRDTRGGRYRYGYDIDGDGYAYGSKHGTVTRNAVTISGGRDRALNPAGDPNVPNFSHNGRRMGRDPESDLKSDSGSDKSILNLSVAPGRIMQTREVVVNYQQRPKPGDTAASDERSDGYELDRMN